MQKAELLRRREPFRGSIADWRESARRITPGGPAWWNIGWLVMAAAFALSLIGIATIDTTQPGQATRQVVHLAVGVLCAICVAVPDYRRLRRFTWPIAIIAVCLLVFVLLPMVPESLVRPRNGARRWISLGVTDVQPSELAKIAWIALMAEWLVRRRSYRRFGGFVLCFLVTLVPFLLILKEPDLGTALLFIPTLLVMLVAAGARLRHVLLVLLCGISLGPLAYFTPGVLKPHQVARVDAIVAQFQGDDRLERDEGFQAARARVVVGSGGLTGVGRDHAASIVSFNRLPEEHNDMIFAVLVCRWGLVGGLCLWVLFIVLGLAGLRVAAGSRDAFGRLMVVGIVAMIFFQMFVNTGMTIGVLPITGMTLPFVSYGGTSLVATWIMAGLVLNVALRRPRRMQREAFDFTAPGAGS
ncbi:MAG: FtsW/RodA/SpoVE family cell cycle protein [Planctomycetota bacterium]|nr:FtsW/RodA/SpoVE family cell cycle protein [Planctomycetota bacterium]